LATEQVILTEELYRKSSYKDCHGDFYSFF